MTVFFLSSAEVPTRALALLGVMAAGGLFLWILRRYRARSTAGTDRIDLTDVGLDSLGGSSAFLVFTTAACRPCKTALRLIDSAAAGSEEQVLVRTIDAVERSDLAARYDVRAIPTVLLVTGEGRIRSRWANPPPVEELRSALASV
jgi:hypothetical protein